jgi:Tol biopolymer transport system component
MRPDQDRAKRLTPRVRLVPTARRLAVAAGLLAACLALLAPSALSRPASSASGAVSASASTTIAFVRGDHIWTIAPNGSGAKQLTSGSYTDGSPAWSPDHGTVYFYRSKSLGEDATLSSVPASGGSSTAVYKDTVSSDSYVEITGVAADPAGGRVVFADISDSPSANLPVCRVVAVDLATGRTTVLLRRVGGFGSTLVVAWHVTWSPDGSKLLVSQAGQDAEGGQTGVLTLADGSVHPLGVTNAANADWSADGASVLVSVDGQRGTSIKIVSLNGKVIRKLAGGGGWSGPPAVYGARFSPDGGRVAYAKGPSQVWLMQANGSGKHKLTKGTEPAWR